MQHILSYLLFFLRRRRQQSFMLTRCISMADSVPSSPFPDSLPNCLFHLPLPQWSTHIFDIVSYNHLLYKFPISRKKIFDLIFQPLPNKDFIFEYTLTDLFPHYFLKKMCYHFYICSSYVQCECFIYFIFLPGYGFVTFETEEEARRLQVR